MGVKRAKAKTAAKSEPRVLRIFISYASEDLKIAHAVASALAGALPDGFAEICFDKWSLHAGEEFKSQIKAKLEKSDILLIISTGAQKDAYAFPSWEVGFFEGVMRREPHRRMVPIYLEHPPADAAGFQGFDLKIPMELLPQSVDEFSAKNDIPVDDSLCAFVRGLQEEVERIKTAAGFSCSTPLERRDPVTCVKAMRLAIFCHMKTKVEAVLKPQKQITIQSSGSEILKSDTDLPLSARLVPSGGNSMDIFGLPDEEMTWGEFLDSTAGSLQDSWKEAITSVVISSHAGRINVDNTQIIPSRDESKTYRIILTTATKYWDDRREFNLYFVESSQPEDYGDRDTTLLLKGLQSACRYRFLFLETTSLFSADNLLTVREERLPELAAKLLKQLNLMKAASRRAGLDQPAFWSQFLAWDVLREMSDGFLPRERRIRDLTGQILSAKDRPETLIGLRQELAKILRELEDATRIPNAALIEAMTNRLLEIIKEHAAPYRAPMTQRGSA